MRTTKNKIKTITIWRVECTDHLYFAPNETRAEQYATKAGTKALDVQPWVVECTKDKLVEILNATIRTQEDLMRTPRR